MADGKPDGTIFLFFKFTESQGHTPTLKYNLQMKHASLVIQAD
jgi:hypothetical protein